MRARTVVLAADHAEEAARLIHQRQNALRRRVPELPEIAREEKKLAEKIARLARQAPGAAAFDGGRLVGFLGAMPIRYAGRPSMMSPEWGNGVAQGADPEHERRVHEALYAAVAEEWTSARVETHIACLLAHDSAAVEAFSWFGFGRVVCDAVRGLEPVISARGPERTRRATAADAGLVRSFDVRLHDHLASPPALLLREDDEDEARWSERLADSTRAAWLADDGRAPVGYLLQGPASDCACDVVADPGTSSITGAYVVPQARGGDAATSLLSRAVEWARERGYVRLSVDFETANGEAVRFWLRHFRPVVFSMARTIRAEGS